MSSDLIIIGLLALAGFLAGGAYTVWKGGTSEETPARRPPAGRPAPKPHSPRWLAVALGLAAAMAVAAAVVRMF